MMKLKGHSSGYVLYTFFVYLIFKIAIYVFILNAQTSSQPNFKLYVLNMYNINDARWIQYKNCQLTTWNLLLQLYFLHTNHLDISRIKQQVDYCIPKILTAIVKSLLSSVKLDFFNTADIFFYLDIKKTPNIYFRQE